MRIVPVKTENIEYRIYIGGDVTRQTEAFRELSSLVNDRRCWILADDHTAALFGTQVEERLREAGATVAGTQVVQAGENAKCLEVAGHLYDKAVEAGLDRRSLITALGGGVIGDLGGFIAATYLRGIDFIQWPTTLLAQVDSSVGGKVAIDLPAGKNLVGAFHQPRLVAADLLTLDTLPRAEFEGGLAEVVKYGVIMDEDFFAFLERHADEINRRQPEVMETVVERCCCLKAQVVQADARESGMREILNYGHTFGHALEVLAGYGQLSHGAAVAIGMTMAAELAAEKALFSRQDKERQTSLLREFGLPVKAPAGIDSGKALEIMRHDKKSRDRKLRLVLPRRIGAVEVTAFEEESRVARAMEICCE